MFNLGAWEIVVILVVVLVIFGPSKLPALGSALGEGIKNFKKSYRDSRTIDITDQTRPEDSPGDSEEKKQ